MNNNRFGTLLHFVRHIADMAAAGGKKRVGYAFMNIIWMAAGVAAAVGVRFLAAGISDGSINFVLGVIGLIVCAVIALVCFLEGFLAQFALVFIAGIGISNPEERGGNVAALVIALITSVGLVIACIMLLMWL